MSVVGICPDCVVRIDANKRWEETCVARSTCASCGERGTFSAFKVRYLGEWDCSDCLTMTHCETHHKDENLYPTAEVTTQRQGEGEG